MSLPPMSDTHKSYTLCEQRVKIKVNLHNPTVNSTEPSLHSVRDGQPPVKEGASSAQCQGIQVQLQVDNNQSLHSVRDGQPPFKEGASSAQCQGIQVQPQVDNNHSLNSVRDGQPPLKEGAGSAQCQGIQEQPQNDDKDQSLNSLRDGQPPLKEGAGSAQCQGIQEQPQNDDNDQSLNSVRDGQPPLKEGAGSAQCQGMQEQPQDDDNDQSLNSVRDGQPPLKEGAGSAQCQGMQKQPQNDDKDQHPGRKRPSSSRVLNLRGNLTYAEGSQISAAKWIHYEQAHFLQICSSTKRPSLGKHCRTWKRDKVLAVFNKKINDYCVQKKLNLNEILLVYTDGAVQKNGSGWGFRAVYRQNIIREGYGGYNYCKNSLDMEAEAVWHVLSWLVRSNRNITGFFKNVIILMDCKSIVDKIKNKLVRQEWLDILNELSLTENFCLTWMYVPGHCGIPDNEAVDNLASLGCKIFSSSSSRNAT